ncbi:MAG TPA: DUF5655 domain-containing protein [Vicinamibacterales bacterium]|nr:DUF5655 domain-containing protein [Vicinamibacterales bacterium]
MRPLWTCPKCRHQFVTRNLWHSCVRVPISAHFQGRAAELRPAFGAFADAAEACGPVTIYAQKTRIVVQARVRFAGVVVRAGFIDAGLWLKERARHPRLIRTEVFGSLGYGLHFRLERPSDVDAALRRLVRRAYREAIAGPAQARRHGRRRPPGRSSDPDPTPRSS